MVAAMSAARTPDTLLRRKIFDALTLVEIATIKSARALDAAERGRRRLQAWLHDLADRSYRP